MLNLMPKSACLFFCLTLACSGEKAGPPSASTAIEKKAPPPPTAEAVKPIIEGSAEWGDFRFTYVSASLPMRASAMHEGHRQSVKELREAGWLSVDGDGNVVLSTRAKGDKRFLERPNATLDIVPLAKKEFGTVESLQPQPDGSVIATVSWRWLPNEVGASFKSGLVQQELTATHRARVTLQHDGTRWSVWLIEAG